MSADVTTATQPDPPHGVLQPRWSGATPSPPTTRRMSAPWAMRLRLATFVLAAAAGAALLSAPAVQAAPCGEPDAGAKAPSTQPPRAALALDEKSSRTALVFKRDTGHQRISLVFNASGCTLPANPAPPRLVVFTKSGSKDLPDEALSVKSVEADGGEYDLKVDVDAGAFGPGTYDGQLSARAPYLSPTNRTPISVSRSENRIWVPLLIGALAGLAGLLWFVLLKAAAQTALAVTRIIVGLVALACMLAGAAAVFVSYWDQDVWLVSENLLGAVIAGFTGATTGAMASLVGVLFKQSPRSAGTGRLRARARRAETGPTPAPPGGSQPSGGRPVAGEH